MPRLKRFLILFPLFLAGVIALGLGALFTCYPKVDAAEDREVPKDLAAVDRGGYLVDAVAACSTCHAERDWTRLGGPPLPGAANVGGARFDRELGLPGVFVTPNLTAAHLGDWSDGEIARAIVSGVDAEGTPLMPVMPYLSYAGLCGEDVDAIVAYLRTLPADARHLDAREQRELDFPLPLLIRTFPQSGELGPCPLEQDAAELRGGYLARAAGCGNCHTPMKEGRPVLDKSFAGGSPFLVMRPDGKTQTVHAPNISADPKTGIGSWSKAEFVERFSRYRDPAQLELGPEDRPSNMPWAAYTQMSDADLEAIYDFLMSQPPVANRVRGYTERAYAGPDAH